MKRLYLLLTLTLTLACQHSAQHRELAAGTWDSQVREQINGLMESCKDSGAYAVFDFDKTTIVHDVSQAREQNNTGRYLLQPNFAPIRGKVDGGGI